VTITKEDAQMLATLACHAPAGACGVRWPWPRPKHHHQWVRVGYGGAGWSLFQCWCGATEIDA
jgi:hypothetical protein